MPAAARPSTEILRHRRGLALFGALLVVAVIIAVIAGIGGGDSGPATLSTLPPPAPASGQGIALSAPSTWERVDSHGVTRLRSPEGDVQVLVSSPALSGEAGAALHAELKAIGNTYQVLSEAPATIEQIGGLKGRQIVVSAQQANGKQVRILVITANGSQRAYVVEVVAAADASGHRLAEGQQIVNSLRLTG